MSSASVGQGPATIRARYEKAEFRIPMRDGMTLFTAVYSPRNTAQKYPILMTRTPYDVGPYGPTEYKNTLGPGGAFVDEGYIFVYQDVRGRYMSEGNFKWMTPYIAHKSGPMDVDESSDTYDTIDWLLKNTPNNNGRVGIYGISYPGFYSASALVDSHPALKAVSPQAPMADNYLGDDIHHNGAFWLPHIFTFINLFGRQRDGPTTTYPQGMNLDTADGYRFFLEVGPLANVNNKYFYNVIPLWNEWMEHGDYDKYWKSQNVPQHLKKVKPAVMTVGGWFDAEDLQGTLRIYQAIEKSNPGIFNVLVMGPWFHGGWSFGPGDELGGVPFGSSTAEYYRENIELPFFNFYLKDKANPKLPEAFVFETGSNQWRTYDQWPPKDEKIESFYFQPNGQLGESPPSISATKTYDEYESDPANPVPYFNGLSLGMNRDYMDADQRFVSSRPDVLVYQTGPLLEDITAAGPVDVRLFVSTSGTDSDFVVKLIDVFPDADPLSGYEMLVRGEPFRAKYRNSMSKPVPMTPNKPTPINYEMPDINHTFLKGHRIMIQVQSTWFPLMDRNPQKFVDIYKAVESDFHPASERLFHSTSMLSSIQIHRVLR